MVGNMTERKKLEELRRQLAECGAELKQQEGAAKGGKQNVNDVCDGLIAMNHYFHILLLLDVPDLDKAVMYAYWGMADETIAKIKNKERKRRAILKMELISKHTNAWNMAHFYYERAVKTLCMMLVTLMDYIIQEQGGISLLYQETDMADGAEKYQNLLDEITALNGDYRADYFAVCSFDFCTKKLGGYLDVPFYEDIACEHERIIDNGNPQRVTGMMNRLREMTGEEAAVMMKAIEKAYTPEPPYDEALFEACYQEAFARYETQEAAMEAFNGLVTNVSSLYQSKIQQ